MEDHICWCKKCNASRIVKKLDFGFEKLTVILEYSFLRLYLATLFFKGSKEVKLRNSTPFFAENIWLSPFRLITILTTFQITKAIQIYQYIIKYNYNQ